MADEMQPKLPGYLRLLLTLYREGMIEEKQRRKLGFTMNDVYMLEAYGLVRRADGCVIITGDGIKWVEQQILSRIFPKP